MGREKSLNLLTTKADILIIVCKIQVSTKFGYFSFKALVQEYQGVMEPASFTLKNALMCLALLFQLAEVVCYISMYKNLYIHDTLMMKRSVISNETYRNRQRTNIFSMGGQLCCFLAELIYLANMMIWTNVIENYSVTSMKEIYFVIKICEFGFLSTVQVLTSRDLRNMLKSCVKIKIL